MSFALSLNILFGKIPSLALGTSLLSFSYFVGQIVDFFCEGTSLISSSGSPRSSSFVPPLLSDTGVSTLFHLTLNLCEPMLTPNMNKDDDEADESAVEEET